MSFGGGGQQTTTQEFKPPSWAAQYYPNYVASGVKISQNPYAQSGLPQVAPINDYQNTAMQLMYDSTLYGTPMANAANGAFTNAAKGNYANPYAQNVSGIASGQAANPWSYGIYGAAQNATSNPYLAALGGAIGGSNPYATDDYTKKLIDDSNAQLINAYKVGGAAQNDAAAAMSGAFGGSAYDEQVQRNQAGLGNQISTNTNNILNQQQQYKGAMYNQDYQNLLQGLGMGIGGYNSGLGQQLQALGMGSANYNADVGNQLAANQQAGNYWNQDISNILSGGALGLQGDSAYMNKLQGLMGAGNSWNNYYQKLLDSANSQWNTQNTYDANMNEYLGSVLGRASGSWGSTASTQPGQDPLSAILGAGLTGAGIYSLWK